MASAPVAKAERLHGAMRLNGMAEQESAGQNSVQKRHWSQAERPMRWTWIQGALWRRMRLCSAGRTTMPPVVLVTGTSRLAAGLAIITPPSSTPKLETVAPPAAAITSPMVMPTGTRRVTGCSHGAGHGEVFVRHRPVEADVHQGFNVGDGCVHILGQAAGRNHASGDHVHEDELVAGGVTVRQRNDADAGRRLALQRGNDVVVLLLDADDAFARADHLHGHAHAAQERLGVVVEQFLVFVQQGLALGGVGNHQGGAGLELDGRGKSAAARADDAELFNAVDADVPATGSELELLAFAVIFGSTSKSIKYCD